MWKEFADKTVLDFGCEAGVEAIDIARHGARRVVGIDLREDALSEARKAAEGERPPWPMFCYCHG